MGTTIPLTPSADLLELGAGSLLFNREDPVTKLKTGLVHLGNVPTFELTPSGDTLTKNESMTRVKGIYAQVQRNRTLNGTVNCDEYSPSNLAMALGGTVVQTIAQAGGSTTEAHGLWKPGQYYKLNKQGPVTGVTVTVGGAAAAAFNPVTGVGDFEVADPEAGLIRAHPATLIAAGGAVSITYTATAFPGGLTKVQMGTESKISGSMLFVGDPTRGLKKVIELWRVSITANGAVGFITDDWGSVPLGVSVEADLTNHPLSPYGDITFLP